MKKSLFSLTGLLLVGGLLYSESTLSSSPQPSTAPSEALSLQLTSPEQLWILTSGVHPGIRMGPSYAVKSNLHDGRWYVGAKVYHVLRGEMAVATWLMTGSKTNPGLVFSADSAAQALSIWPSPQERFSVSEGRSEVRALVTALKEQ